MLSCSCGITLLLHWDQSLHTLLAATVGRAPTVNYNVFWPGSLLPVQGVPQGSGVHTMWSHLLFHLPEDLLGPHWPHRFIHVSRVQSHLQQETYSKACNKFPIQHHAAQLWILPSTSSISWLQLRRTPGCRLWHLRRQEVQSHQDVLDVSGILLREASQASLWVGHVQEAQAGGWNWPPGQTDLSPASERSGAVLPHRRNVYLCAVYGEGAQRSWHGVCWTRESRRTGWLNFS